VSEQNAAEYARREAIYATAKASECSVCLRQMGVRLENGQPVVRCQTDPTHEGYRRLRSLTQLAKDGMYIPYVSERVQRKKEEQLEEQIQDPETRALAVYGGDRQMMTTEIAQKIVAHIWPGAPADAVARAVMICAQNNLNPLMKHLYIIHYPSKSGGPGRDECVLGIDGYRIIARRRSPFSYREGPRAMTAEEIEARGEDPKQMIGSVVVLETPGGGRFPGYGFWRRDQEPLGIDKGNTKGNMADKRAEAAAFRRIMPDNELPVPVALDVAFSDISDYVAIAAPSTVNTETGEISEDLGRCPVHNKAFKQGQYGPYCGKKLADGTWCKEKPMAQAKAPARPVPTEVVTPPATRPTVTPTAQPVQASPEGQGVPASPADALGEAFGPQAEAETAPPSRPAVEMTPTEFWRAAKQLGFANAKAVCDALQVADAGVILPEIGYREALKKLQQN